MNPQNNKDGSGQTETPTCPDCRKPLKKKKYNYKDEYYWECSKDGIVYAPEVKGQTETDDLRYKKGHHECNCHNPAVKTIAPCYLCREQNNDEQCSLCAKVGTEIDELDAILNNITWLTTLYDEGKYSGEDLDEAIKAAKAAILRYSHHQLLAEFEDLLISAYHAPFDSPETAFDALVKKRIKELKDEQH